MGAYQDVYSSDSTPFADKGIPAVSFARIAPNNTATIHNSYDTMAVMKMEHMEKDVAFISKFVERMVNAAKCPVAREMPDNMKEKFVGIAKVGEKGQIVIPKEARDMFDINPGDSIIVLCDKAKGIALLKADEIEDMADKVFPKGEK